MTPSPGADRRWSVDRKISFGQLLTGLLSLLIAIPSLYFAWSALRPAGDTDVPAPQAHSATSTPATLPSSAAPIPASGQATYLDSLTPEKGGGLLIAPPREVKDQAGYTHSLALECPSNSTGDLVREVSYPLSRRYVKLDATVRPYFEIEADRPSVSHVTVLVGTRERDGTITTRETGAQRSATMAAPRDLAADLEDGDVLTIRVACAVPTGVIILTEARLTPA